MVRVRCNRNKEDYIMRENEGGCEGEAKGDILRTLISMWADLVTQKIVNIKNWPVRRHASAQ